jgi:pyruvate/2-oxoglutarate dehydrogenase complex dihydrolipoamide dehydrogenase (E3) component
MSAVEFDVIVIGAGPAGEVAAGRLAQKGGRKVAIVEQRLVGGECAFYACMPSKALLRPAELLGEARRVPGVAQAVRGDLDVEAVLTRRDQVISDLDDSGHLPWLRTRGIEVLRGSGEIVGEREVKVGERVLRARDAVILATGSAPLIPPIPGLSEVSAWSNREITTAHQPPRRLIVLGGGPVGVEMAQAWSSLGSHVSLIEAAPRLLPREEPFAGEQLADAFINAGIAISLGDAVISAALNGGETVLTLGSGAEIRGDRLLVAIGRRPMSGGVGLERLGIDVEKPIEVDRSLRVPGHDWLYAVGDVNGRALLTHFGKYQARIAADHILGERAQARIEPDASPRVLFTDPQVAAAGLTLKQASKAGMKVQPVDVQTSDTAGASFYGRETPGLSRLVIDVEREVIVGATFVGFEVADFLQAATIAIVGEVPLRRLAHAIAPFPTRSELWLKLLEAYGEHYID